MSMSRVYNDDAYYVMNTMKYKSGRERYELSNP